MAGAAKLLDEIAAMVKDVQAKEAARDAAAKAFSEAAAAHKDAAVKLTAKQAELNEMLGGVLSAVDSKVRIG